MDVTIGLASSKTDEDAVPHGKICYLEIPANGAEASADFYGSIFGWRVRNRGDGELAFDDTGGVSGTWVTQGGSVVTPRTEIGPGMGAFAVFADLGGNTFGLYEEPRR